MKRLIILVGCAVAMFAQEVEPRFGLVRVKQATTLRAQPRLASPAVKDVDAGTELRWVMGQQSGDYLRVLPPKGPQGWIRAEEVDITSQMPPMAALTQSVACQNSLAACTPDGCAAHGSDHALMNSIKRRSPAAGAPLTDITTAALVALQDKTDTVVNQGEDLSAAERHSIVSLTTLNGNHLGEGSFVRFLGFISVGAAPHPNTGESVNCGLTGTTNNDFHINVTSAANFDEFEGFVIETIPQNRPAAWSLTKLAKLQTQHRKILVSGQLFYDNVHVVNGDSSHSLPGQPKRFTLWEIHPVSVFLVCKNLNGPCDKNTASHWQPLASFQ